MLLLLISICAMVTTLEGCEKGVFGFIRYSGSRNFNILGSNEAQLILLTEVLPP